jgi:hypothetical protein
MPYDLTPAEALQSLQDSIRSAESVYDECNIVFSSDALTLCINIALRKIVPGLGSEERHELLRVLFSRDPGKFNSSRDMTMAGALALRARIYGPNAYVDKYAPMLSDAVAGIKEAYKQVAVRPEVEFV